MAEIMRMRITSVLLTFFQSLKHCPRSLSLVEFEQVILLGSTSAGQEIIYPVGGRWVGAFSRWVGGRWVVVLQYVSDNIFVGDGFSFNIERTISFRRRRFSGKY